MSHVFISYKREDEARVARIARALETALKGEGVEVWWDRGLPGGESWRANIEANLDKAAVVVVVWSRASVAPEGHFVRDEAARGRDRGILVPLLIDWVKIPLGFGEVQAIDLVRWRGAARDPFFQDLLSAIRAKLSGAPAPKARGPISRLAQRLALAAVSTASLGFVAALASNTFGTAQTLCTAPLMQPGLSDACGACGLGGRPSHAERMAWKRRRPGVCQDLRDHINAFPRGAYRGEAQALLTARSSISREVWTPATRTLVLYQPSDVAAADEPSARALALKDARPQAERLCRGFAASGDARLMAAEPRADRWSCEHEGSRVACSFDGWAECRIQERQTKIDEVCGPAAPRRQGSS
jgi:hypothetical protein